MDRFLRLAKREHDLKNKIYSILWKPTNADTLGGKKSEELEKHRDIIIRKILRAFNSFAKSLK